MGFDERGNPNLPPEPELPPIPQRPEGVRLVWTVEAMPPGAANYGVKGMGDSPADALAKLHRNLAEHVERGEARHAEQRQQLDAVRAYMESLP